MHAGRPCEIYRQPSLALRAKVSLSSRNSLLRTRSCQETPSTAVDAAKSLKRARPSSFAGNLVHCGRRQRQIESWRRSGEDRGKGHAERSLARGTRRNETVTLVARRNYGIDSDGFGRYGRYGKLEESRRQTGSATFQPDLIARLARSRPRFQFRLCFGVTWNILSQFCLASSLCLSLSLSLFLFELTADLNGTCFATRIFTRSLRISLFNGGKVSGT